MPPSVWTMNQKSNDKSYQGIPLLLVLLLVLLLAAKTVHVPGAKPVRCQSPVFVELKGDVAWPRVVAACEPLDLSDGATAKWVFGVRLGGDLKTGAGPLRSGTALDVKIEGGKVSLSKAEMSPFYKATLGIPILINDANPDALTAVPGIGLKLARRIVWERDRRGGFRRFEELMTISGIGPGLYKRIRPHLAL
jgi:DNA uptake protein ComE-like DNA-binding protein